MPDSNRDKNEGSGDYQLAELDYHIKLPDQTNPVVHQLYTTSLKMSCKHSHTINLMKWKSPACPMQDSLFSLIELIETLIEYKIEN